MSEPEDSGASIIDEIGAIIVPCDKDEMAIIIGSLIVLQVDYVFVMAYEFSIDPDLIRL
jgi:hypothetical protein